MAPFHASNQKEKRRHIRHSVHEVISYTINGSSFSTQTIDIGAGGIKFATSQFIPPMTPATITLQKAPRVPFQGVVIWSVRIDSHCTAAVKFSNLSSEQQNCLEQLL